MALLPSNHFLVSVDNALSAVFSGTISLCEGSSNKTLLQQNARDGYVKHTWMTG